MDRYLRYVKSFDSTAKSPILQVMGIDAENPSRVFTIGPSWPKPFWPELRDLLRRFGNDNYTEWAALLDAAGKKPNEWIFEKAS